MSKKKKDFSFYWEQPTEEAAERIQEKFLEMPSGFSFPKIKFPGTDMSIPVNIAESEKEIIVRAEISGFEKGEISLSVTESSVEIIASKSREKTEKGANSFRKEKSSQALRRLFTLPANIDPDSSEAKLEDGMLAIRMIKLSSGKKKRKRIEIN